MARIKITLMVSLDTKTLSELKLAGARFYQRLYASDDTWNHFESVVEVYKQVLPSRRKLQRLARRHEKSPSRFCERMMGPNWFEPPKNLSRHQIRALLKISSTMSMLALAPEEIGPLDGKPMLNLLQTLTARLGGRKPLEIYAKARELAKTNPPMSFHRICLQLNPAYAGMTPAEKRSERERMRSGVTRLKRKTTAARRSTK